MCASDCHSPVACTREGAVGRPAGGIEQSLSPDTFQCSSRSLSGFVSQVLCIFFFFFSYICPFPFRRSRKILQYTPSSLRPPIASRQYGYSSIPKACQTAGSASSITCNAYRFPTMQSQRLSSLQRRRRDPSPQEASFCGQFKDQIPSGPTIQPAYILWALFRCALSATFAKRYWHQ